MQNVRQLIVKIGRNLLGGPTEGNMGSEGKAVEGLEFEPSDATVSHPMAYTGNPKCLHRLFPPYTLTNLRTCVQALPTNS